MHFYAGQAGSLEERMIIAANGRIGMSQSSPDSATLHIGNSVASTGSNVALQVGTISGQNRYLTINHLNNQQNFYQIKMRVNDNGLIAMLDMGNPYGSQNHGTKIKFSGYQDNQVGSIEVQNQANNSTNTDMIFEIGGTTEALRLHNNGCVTMANHSRFATHIAYTSGNEAANSKIAMADAHVNVGSDFSDSNDRFTAPVDGDYAFWFHTNVAKSGSGAYYATWYKNGSEVNSTAAGRMYDQHSGSGWHNLSGCIMLNLSEGDYVEVYNGSVVVNYDGNSYGQWMGWLVG